MSCECNIAVFLSENFLSYRAKGISRQHPVDGVTSQTKLSEGLIHQICIVDLNPVSHHLVWRPQPNESTRVVYPFEPNGVTERKPRQEPGPLPGPEPEPTPVPMPDPAEWDAGRNSAAPVDPMEWVDRAQLPPQPPPVTIDIPEPFVNREQFRSSRPMKLQQTYWVN